MAKCIHCGTELSEYDRITCPACDAFFKINYQMKMNCQPDPSKSVEGSLKVCRPSQTVHKTNGGDLAASILQTV